MSAVDAFRRRMRSQRERLSDIERSASAWGRLEWFAFGSLVLGLVVPTLLLAPRYAPTYDELWNVPEAWLILDRGSTIPSSWTFSIFGRVLPLVGGPYHGAIKSYLLAPWVGLFGTSPAVLRLFNAVAGIALGLACFWAIRPVVSRRAACVCLLMPLVFTNFSFSVQGDAAPFLLGALFLVMAAGCIVRGWRSPRQRWLIGSMFFLGLAAADKLTTMPIVAFGCFAVGFLILLRRQTYLHPRPIGFGVAAATVPLIPSVIYFLREGTGEFRRMTAENGGERHGYFESLTHNLPLLRRGLFNTTDPQSVAFVTSRRVAGVPELGTAVLWLVCLSVVAWVAMMLVNRRPAASALFVVWPVGADLLFPLFGGLNQTWHFLPLLPLLFVGMVCFVVQLSRAVRPLGRHVPTAVLTLWSALGLTLMACSFVAQRDVLRAGGRGMASPALFEIAEVVKASGRHEIVCLDYSVCNTLRAALGTDYQIAADYAFVTRDDSFLSAIRSSVSEPSRVLVVRVIDAENGLDVPAPTSLIDFLNSGSAAFLESLSSGEEFVNVGQRDVNGTHFSLFVAP